MRDIQCVAAVTCILAGALTAPAAAQQTEAPTVVVAPVPMPVAQAPAAPTIVSPFESQTIVTPAAPGAIASPFEPKMIVSPVSPEGTIVPSLQPTVIAPPGAQRSAAPTPAQQKPAPAAPVPTPPAAPAPAQVPALAPPATPQAAPAPPAAPARVAAPATVAPFNYRVDVQVTDRLDAKVLSQETFTALAAPTLQTKISRTTPGVTSAALQVTVAPKGGSMTESLRIGPSLWLTLGAEFNFAKGAAGDKDPGVEVGQQVAAMVPLGKPVTVIDISSSSEGRRRFIVQVTVTQVPVE
jgi:hypothetical protein